LENNRKAIIAMLVLFVIAVLVTVYPVISSYLYDKHGSRVQAEYFEAIEQMDDEAIENARQEAKAYNALLAKGVYPAFSDEQLNSAYSSYNELLNLNGNGTMGYIEIPAIALNLPVAHGTAAETLEHAVGHVVGSSLPIGGDSTHAVLSGHSGMAGQKMFTDLHELKTGDTVYLHVLKETLAYEVESTETVRPEETDGLAIEQGKDRLTLITCTPIGINSHRLLVHCSRVPYVPEEEPTEAEAEPVQSSWQRQYLEGLGCGVAALLLAFACYELTRLWRGRHGKRA